MFRVVCEGKAAPGREEQAKAAAFFQLFEDAREVSDLLRRGVLKSKKKDTSHTYMICFFTAGDDQRGQGDVRSRANLWLLLREITRGR